MPTVQLDALDLAALLCSRVCHDVISPVGAIINGLEVMEEDKDAAMHEFAMDLIAKSAKQASARLQFARLAFGAAGSAGASIDLGDAASVARGFIQDDKTKLGWDAPRAFAPKNKAKLLLNLLMVATGAVPRGGTIDVVMTGEGDTMAFRIEARGAYSRVPAAAAELIAGRSENGQVDAHGIQAYYAGLIAKEAGMQVSVGQEGDAIVIEARPQAV